MKRPRSERIIPTDDELIRMVAAREYGIHNDQWYWHNLRVVGRSGPPETHASTGRALRRLVKAGRIGKPAYAAGLWGEPQE